MARLVGPLERARGRARGMALAALVTGGPLLPTLAAAAAPPDLVLAQPAATPAKAPTASSAAATPPRVSPYVIAARQQHAQAAPGAAHAPSVPPSMRRTRQPIGQQPRP
jgi:hypothetical protein